MFCEKCGTNVPEGANCPNCGHTQGLVRTTGNGGKAEDNWFIKLVKHSKFIIVALSSIILSGTKPVRDGIYWNFMHLDTYYLATLAKIIGLGICIAIIVFSNKNKSLINYQCPKCGKFTHHNRYNVCTNCNFDCESSIYLSLVYFLGCIIMPYIIHDKDICDIVSVIATVIIFIIPIYMYPAKLARRTEHSAATAIFWLNIFLGGTFIMWIILLIWGSSGKGNAKTVVIQQAPTQPAVGNSFEELQKLKDMEMISTEEFEEKRKELLKRI